MPRKKEAEKVRGVFERPIGSDVWWVQYFDRGRRKREKVGSKGAAIKLYLKRRGAIVENRKLPELDRSKIVTLSQLIDDALEYAEAHIVHTNDYVSKAKIVRPVLGCRPAAEITPQEIDRWLEKRFKTPATANRYKNFISVAYREGMRNGKVVSNPARLVRQRKENNSRIRFLTRDEYDAIFNSIMKHNPAKLPEFVFSVQTAMRWSEQYGIVWSQVDFKDKFIRDVETKSKNAQVLYRDVPLSDTAIAALRQHQAGKAINPTDKVFPLPGAEADHRWWFNPALKEAKVKNYSWHCNRHTTCSWMSMAGASLKEVQQQAGHKTIAMSARYSHLSPSHSSAATSLIRPPD